MPFPVAILWGSGFVLVFAGARLIIAGAAAFAHLTPALALDLREGPEALDRLRVYMRANHLERVWALVTGHVASPVPLLDLAGAPAAAIFNRRLQGNRRLLGLGPQTLVEQERLDEAPVWGLAAAAAPAPAAGSGSPAAAPAAGSGSPAAAPAPQLVPRELVLAQPLHIQAQLAEQQPAQQQGPPLVALLEPGAFKRQHAGEGGARVATALLPGPSHTHRPQQSTWATIFRALTSLALPDTETHAQQVLPLGALVSVLGSVTLTLRDGGGELRIGGCSARGLGVYLFSAGMPSRWQPLLQGLLLCVSGYACLQLAVVASSGGVFGGGSGGGGGGGGNPVTSIFHTQSDNDSPATDGAPRCCLCFENRPSVLLEPCGHLVLCSACARRYLVANKKTDCPICRGRVLGTKRTFS